MLEPGKTLEGLRKSSCGRRALAAPCLFHSKRCTTLGTCATESLLTGRRARTDESGVAQAGKDLRQILEISVIFCAELTGARRVFHTPIAGPAGGIPFAA